MIQIVANLHCRGKKEFVFDRIRNAIKDGYWIDRDTIQLVVPGKKFSRKIPVSQKRKLSCQDAGKKIKKYFQNKYPHINIKEVSSQIRARLYEENGSCRLVVWYTRDYLRDDI